MMLINIRAFALTCGIFLGTAIFIGTWWLLIRGDMAGQETIIGSMYPGYRISPLGSIMGFIYGSAEGFFSGMVFAWLYNLITGKNNRQNNGRIS